MKKIIVLAIVSFLVSTGLDAQVISGYKGKRTIIGVNIPFSPIPWNGKVHNGFGVDIERVKQNYVSLNYSFKYFNSEMPLKTFGLQSYYYDEDIGGDVYYDPGGSFQLKRQEHKVTYKFYSKRRGSLAPLGAYWNMGLSFDINKIDPKNVIMDISNGSRYIGEKELSYFDVVPHISRGYKYVLADKLFLDLEFLFRFSVLEYLTVDQQNEFLTRNKDQSVKGDVKFTNLGNSLFQINFGLKYAL